MKTRNKFFLGFLLFLLLVAVLVPLLVPKELLRETLVEETAKATGLDLELGEISWQWLPSPAIHLSELKIKENGQDLISVTRLSVLPAIVRLFDGEVAVEKMTLSEVRGDFYRIKTWLDARPGGGQGSLELKRIIVNDLMLSPLLEQVGPMNIDLRLGPGMTPEHLEARLVSGSATVNMKAIAEGQQIRLKANNWVLPGMVEAAELSGEAVWKTSLEGAGKGPQLTFNLNAREAKLPAAGLHLNSLNLRGSLDDELLSLEEIELETWGGSASAKASGSIGNDLNINFNISLHSIDIERISSSYDLPLTRGILAASGGGKVVRAEHGMHWEVVAKASGTRIEPPNSGLLLDEVNLDFQVTREGLDYKNLLVGLYGGAARGEGKLNWRGGLLFEGTINAGEIALEPMLLALKQPTAKGDLGGTVSFSWRNTQEQTPIDQVQAAADPLSGLELKGELEITDGFYPHVDLLDASRLLPGKKSKNRGTAFERLHTRFKLKEGDVQFRDLKLNSKLLVAEGELKIIGGSILQGVIEVGGNDAIGATTVPLKIGGTLDDPSVRPTTAAMVGGAVGTAILGPGLGTAVGTKAAAGLDKLKGLFTNRDE